MCKIPSAETLSKVYNSGSFFENFVVIELLKSWIHNGEEPHFYYYRDTRFNKIDLLILTARTTIQSKLRRPKAIRQA